VKSFLLLAVCLWVLLMASMACSANSSEVKLRIISEEFPPFNYTGPDNTITGQSTEIVREIVKKSGSQASFEMMPWSEGYALVQKNANTVLYSISRIPERENLFKWAGTIGSEENNFYVRKDSRIQISSLEEAKKIGSIAVYKNDSNHLYLAGEGFTNLDVNANDIECLNKLIDGKVDMWLGPAKGLIFMAAKAQLDANAVKPVMNVRNFDWYIAFNKNISDSVVKNWQSKLDEIKQKDNSGSSLYERIIKEYATTE
jgi:polar amino acid transport system substrate-binding protein